MPDITMCGTADCPKRSTCYRSPDSGTRPCEWRQSWSMFGWQDRMGSFDCPHYWRTDDFRPAGRAALARDQEGGGHGG